MSDWLFIACFWISTEVVYSQHCLVWLLHGWCHSELLPSQRILCTPYNQSPWHITSCKATSMNYRLHVCSAVTCYLHFWKNDLDSLCASAVTWGWNGYWNKGQHRMLTLEKEILPLLLPGLEPVTFWSWVWCSDHWAIPSSLPCWNDTPLTWDCLPELQDPHTAGSQLIFYEISSPLWQTARSEQPFLETTECGIKVVEQLQ